MRYRLLRFFSLITGHRVEERGPEVPQLTRPTRGEGRIFLLSPMTVYRYDGHDSAKVHYVRASTLLRSYVIYRWWARRIGFLLRRPSPLWVIMAKTGRTSRTETDDAVSERLLRDHLSLPSIRPTSSCVASHANSSRFFAPSGDHIV